MQYAILQYCNITFFYLSLEGREKSAIFAGWEFLGESRKAWESLGKPRTN